MPADLSPVVHPLQAELSDPVRLPAVPGVAYLPVPLDGGVVIFLSRLIKKARTARGGAGPWGRRRLFDLKVSLQG